MELYLRISIVLSCIVVIVSQNQPARRVPPNLNDTSSVLRYIVKYLDYRIRPLDGTGKPVKVNITVYVQNLHAINEEDMEFGMDMYLRMQWNDPRLKYPITGPALIHLPAKVATGERQLSWIPDVFVSNTRESRSHAMVNEYTGMRLTPDGDVLLSKKLSLVVHCQMSLRAFPFDTNECEVVFESYLLKKNDQQLMWNEEMSKVTSAIHPVAFTLLDTTFGACTTDTPYGDYNCLKITFKVQRIASHYIVVTYIPCILVVIFTCLLFWLPITAILERTIFTSFLFLAMIVITSASQFGTPQAGYVKALDIWNICCLIFMLIAVLEVIIMSLFNKKNTPKADQFELIKDDESTKSDLPANQTQSPRKMFIHSSLIQRVDVAMRIAFPATFVLFNAIYWGMHC